MCATLPKIGQLTPPLRQVTRQKYLPLYQWRLCCIVSDSRAWITIPLFKENKKRSYHVKTGEDGE
jgi:hypothetical protein